MREENGWKEKTYNKQGQELQHEGEWWCATKLCDKNKEIPEMENEKKEGGAETAKK